LREQEELKRLEMQKLSMVLIKELPRPSHVNVDVFKNSTVTEADKLIDE